MERACGEGEYNMRPVSWGGGAQTEKIRKSLNFILKFDSKNVETINAYSRSELTTHRRILS